MADHLHIYAAKGRCITSMPLGQRTLTPAVPVGDATRVAFECFPHGRYLTLWNAEERAGIVTTADGEQIVRIKSIGLVRDMLPTGVTALMTALRKDGIRIEPITGIAASSYQEAVETLIDC